VLMAQRRGIDHEFLRLPRSTAIERSRPVDAAFDSVATRGALRVVDPKEQLCAGERCRVLDDHGDLLYWDDNHLTMRGAYFVEPALARCLGG